jgi:hypothetical protein
LFTEKRLNRVCLLDDFFQSEHQTFLKGKHFF